MQQILRNIRSLKLGALLFLIFGAFLFVGMGEILLFEYLPNMITELKGDGPSGLLVSSIYVIYASILIVLYPIIVLLIFKKNYKSLCFIFFFLVWNICGCLILAGIPYLIYYDSFDIKILFHYSILIFIFINIAFMMYFYYNRNAFK